jgi:hypothetical protein
MIEKHLKKCLESLAIREMQIKTPAWLRSITQVKAHTWHKNTCSTMFVLWMSLVLLYLDSNSAVLGGAADKEWVKYSGDFLWTNSLKNKGANHWSSRRDFQVGEGKRGGGKRERERVFLDRDSMRTRCSYECLWVSTVDLPGFATGGFRFNKAYKLGF